MEKEWNKKKLITYLIVTFAVTYTFWWGLALLTKLKLVDSSQGLFTVMHLIGGFGPTIAAIVVLPKKPMKELFKFAFSWKKGSFWYLLLFSGLQVLTIGLSSRQTNPLMPWYALPIVLFSTTFLGGGNEEIGWRGILQPELEKKFSFPVATLITGCVWMSWHIPLWFVEGTSQQSMNFWLYCCYGLSLSFWLAAIYKKTESVFFCAIFHGLANLLLSFFLVKINGILIVGILLTLGVAVWLAFRE